MTVNKVVDVLCSKLGSEPPKMFLKGYETKNHVRNKLTFVIDYCFY